MWHTGLVALQHVGSSGTRAQTCVPCIGRWILNHCTNREALKVFSFFVCVCFFVFLYCTFLLVINFIHISVYMSIPISQFSTPPSPPHCSFPPLVSLCLFSTSVSQLLPCKPAHLYHFSRFHIHALIYDICFSLSDLLHSV